MKTTVHIVSHSHWDREWYLPFEKHRMHLVELVDAILEKFETDEAYRSFFLDGQTIALDDYLEIRPQKREQIEKYVCEGRLCVGPWYVLQDEFLTSGESCVRNLLTGMESAKKYGKVSHIGYFPDAFGNAGQMPQVLKQAGMEAIAFGRGVKPIGLNNEVKSGQYESTFSEMNWQSNDGSSLPGILFANWYNNGMEIPVDEAQAKIYWDERLAKARQFAGTSHLLFMNGCDHQPVQKNLPEAIAVAKKLYPDIEFIHSDLETYAKAVKEELSDQTSTVIGELTSQETDGCWTLVNTCSANADLKIANRKGESALERQAEPAAAVAFLLGDEYPADLLSYSWKKLMQNHPHDSICCCSVDEVQQEMVTRFNKSKQVADYLISEGKSYIADKIDTSVFEKYCEAIPFSVFNTTGRERTGVISVDLDIVRKSGWLKKCAYEIDEITVPEYKLIDADGSSIPFRLEDLGVTFGFDLPKDKFRQPYMARTVRITFEAENVPVMGYRTYALAEGSDIDTKETLVTGENRMENSVISVQINGNGTLDITDKMSGRIYRGVGYYEETGDIGNEYMYKMPEGTEPITTKGDNAKIELVENEPFRAVYKITNTITVPEAGDEAFEDEKRHMVFFKERKGGRSKNTVELTIETYVSLDKHGKGVKIKTVFDNRAKDHRVRIMVPTGIDSKVHSADSVFELVTRNNCHNACWDNPSACEHEQGFVSIDDGESGIAVANIGLYEYEMLPDMNNTLAITLLRATGEIGDWGVFPAPEAQCIGISETEIEIVPFSGNIINSKAYEECYQFRVDMPVATTSLHKGSMPDKYSMLDWSGEGLTLTGLKAKQDSDDIIIRWVNLSDKPTVLTIKKTEVINNLYQSNIIEQRFTDIAAKDNEYFNIEVKPYEILTVGVERKEA